MNSKSRSAFFTFVFLSAILSLAVGQLKEQPWLREIDIKSERVALQIANRQPDQPIDYYTVSLWPHGGNLLPRYTNVTVRADPGRYEFAGLDECVRYRFNVTGHSPSGTTPVLEESFVNWPTVVPAKPQGLRIQTEGGQAEFTWAIQPNSAAVSHFVIDIQDASGESKIMSQAGQQRSFKVTQCGNYTITVHASNKCGYSEEPASIRAAIPTPGPTELQSNATQGDSILLTWKAPEQIFDPYTYVVSMEDDLMNKTMFNLTPDRRQLLVSLAEGRTYQVNVSTRSKCGLSSPVGPLALSPASTVRFNWITLAVLGALATASSMYYELA